LLISFWAGEKRKFTGEEKPSSQRPMPWQKERNGDQEFTELLEALPERKHPLVKGIRGGLKIDRAGARYTIGK